MHDYLYLIPLIPFLGFLFQVFLGRGLGIVSGYLATLTIGASHVLAWVAWCALKDSGPVSFVGPSWMTVGDFSIHFSFLFDNLSGVMTLFITGIATLIHLYSVGYMADDETPWKFFSYLNLFCGMMLMLVLGDSLPVLFLGWEGVGLCSYLLIGYWHKEMDNAKAAQKAFIANRIGDFFFIIGMFILCGFTGFTSLTFDTLLSGDFINIATSAENLSTLQWGLFCLFLGACGKSAQIPLFVWLPDAMAGPTPVSALIHAATMVTSGLYLLARLSPLFEYSGWVATCIILVGTLTAFTAAFIALTQTDIKKVLAYSTVSQLGYMFVAMGCGAYAVGIFHVFTHAFFKALLFLGSGSVIHGCHHEQDMREMGGLGSKMPVTRWTMAIGTMAITGVPLLSAFYSKEAILTAVAGEGVAFWPIYGALLLTALLTSFYMYRLYYLTFKGEYRGHANPHESPKTMVVPLVILAVGSVLAGVWGHYGELVEFINNVTIADTSTVTNAIQQSFSVSFEDPEHTEHTAHYVLMALGILVWLLGWQFARARYDHGKNIPEVGDSRRGLITNFSLQKCYFDEVYEAFILTPIMNGARFCHRLGDRILIEGLVNGLPRCVTLFGSGLRLFQTGRHGHYALSMGLGIVIVLALIICKGVCS